MNKWIRKAHIIKPNMGEEYPRNIIFFDTETTEVPRGEETELVLKMGVALFWRASWGHNKEVKKWYSFRTQEQFWNWVIKSITDKQRVYLIAHNVGFDLRVVKAFEFFKNNGFISKKIILDNTMNILDFRSKTKSICILDNMNFFKSSLAKLGDSIGVPKMDMPLETDLMALQKYCANDVLVMSTAWEMWIAFLKSNNLGNFAKTIASQAMNAYRHRFMKHFIYVHTNEKAIQLERESYHGGRTECFFIGKMPKRDYHLLDVNSMYPSVMRQYDYPNRLLEIKNSTTEELKARLLTECVTANVILDCPEPVFATKYNNKLIFPTGIFEAVLTTREIEYAFSHDYIRQVKQVAYYEKANLFTEYVDFFYAKKLQYRQEGNEAFEYLCKLFLNSLYGKFGQRNDYYKEVGKDETIQNGTFNYFDLDKQKHIKQRVINGVMEESEGKVEGFDSFVAIVAHITADARMKLWEYFNLAGRDNVYYCDTDSMIVNTYGFARCKNEIRPDLGYLSIKKQTDILEIRGAKDYTLGDEEVIKGIRKDAIKIDRNRYRQVQFEGLHGALQHGRLDKMFIRNIDKVLTRKYDKGIVLKSGQVIPHNLKYQQPLWIM